MLHWCLIFWSDHLWYNWTQHITSTSSCSMSLRLEKNKESFGFDGVFPPTEPMHFISTLSLWVGHTSCEVWESQLTPQISTTEGPKPVKPNLNTKIGLVEGGDITIKGVITRILLFIANRGIWSINFPRRSPIQRTYNTEPSPKVLAWGRNTPLYPGKYAFPLFQF